MKKRKKFPYVMDADSKAFLGQSNDCFEQINRYGTYNIQPTCDTDNTFPSIAQGLPRSLNNVKIEKDELSKE